jgi:hypothetical protein
MHSIGTATVQRPLSGPAQRVGGICIAIGLLVLAPATRAADLSDWSSDQNPGTAARADSENLLAQSPFKPKSESPFKSKADNPFKPKSDTPGSGKSANPFKPSPADADDANAPATEQDGTDAKSDSSRPAKPRGKFKHGKFVPPAPPKDGWNYQPQEFTNLEFEPQRVDISGIDAKHTVKQFPLNRSGKVGAMTTHWPREQTQVNVMDFQAGEVIASVSTPKELQVLAVDDSGERLAVGTDAFGFGENRELGTFLIRDGALVEESVFVPFPDLPVSGVDVEAADFVGDHHLLAVSESGRVSLWNLETLREECGFDLKGNVRIATGPDPSIVAFADEEKFGLFDISRQKFLGVSRLPDGIKRPEIAVSPDGSRLVLAVQDKAVVVDMRNGETELELPLSSVGLQTIEFASNDFLLASSSDLYSIPDRMLVWSYSGAAHSTSVGGTTFFVSGRPETKGTVIPVALPDFSAAGALETARTQPDLYVVRPGVEVKIDVSQVPAQFRQAVQIALSKQLKERDLTVAEESDVVFVAKITGPEQKVVEYGSFGFGGGGAAYEISEYESTLEIQWNGDVAWRKKLTNAPGGITAKKGQSIQDALREATAQPNLKMFEQSGIPAYVPKPDGSKVKSNNALGHSSVDDLGL